MDYYTCSDDAVLLIFKSGDVRGFAAYATHWLEGGDGFPELGKPAALGAARELPSGEK